MMLPNLRSIIARMPSAYNRFSSSFPNSTRGNGSMGFGGFVARAIAVAVGYNIVGPRLNGDVYMKFDKIRQKRLQRLDKAEALLDTYEEIVVRKSKS